MLPSNQLTDFDPYEKWSLPSSPSSTCSSKKNQIFLSMVTLVALGVVTILGATQTLPIGMSGVKICGAFMALPLIYLALLLFPAVKFSSYERQLNAEAKLCGMLYGNYKNSPSGSENEKEAALQLYRQICTILKSVAEFPGLDQMVWTKGGLLDYQRALMLLQLELSRTHLDLVLDTLLSNVSQNEDDKREFLAWKESPAIKEAPPKRVNFNPEGFILSDLFNFARSQAYESLKEQGADEWTPSADDIALLASHPSAIGSLQKSDRDVRRKLF